MTPEIHDQYERLKVLTDMMVPTLALADFEAFDLEKMRNDFRPWANGTLGIIAALDMGVKDLRKSEENLTCDKGYRLYFRT
jgi:hypothetical protein